ncbi:hypothetical protein HDV00_010072 [Rhizophlyctis rosea]|nr:hypothetical protein HDV00_010072 [Rhizophlyctis rosea]
MPSIVSVTPDPIDTASQQDLGITGNGSSHEETQTDLASTAEQYRFDLADCYASGKGLEKDAVAAFGWYQKAANQGYASAQRRLGACFYSGIGTSKDYVEAAKWYRKAADQGDICAEGWLGACYLYGEGVEQDLNRGFDLIERGANLGHRCSEYHLAVCYDDGLGVEKDRAKAFQFFRRAAEQGDRDAQYWTARFYWGGWGDVEVDEKAAGEWFLKAAGNGHSTAQRNVAIMYRDGMLGVEKDLQKAFYWLSKGAESDPDCQLELAFAYLDGTFGAEKNEKLAGEWLQKAAERGHVLSQYNLALRYAQGDWGFEKDEVRASEYYRKSAEGGDIDAQFELGKQYLGGVGVERSTRAAIGWFLKAAEQGHSGAETELYRCGIRDKTKLENIALDYMQKADRGDLDALYELGMAHNQEKWGLGSNWNLRNELLTRAAEAGHILAQFELKMKFLRSDDSGVRAIEWFEMAANQGHIGAQRELGEICTFGRGLYQKSQRMAFRWCEGKAKEGDTIAQYYVGWRLAHREGRIREAIEYFQRSAEGELADAQAVMGELYVSGTGVEKNAEIAADWYRRAAKKGHEKAADALKMLSESCRYFGLCL